MSKKHKYLFIDTETTGTIERPLVYDIGFSIMDKNGNIFKEGSFCIWDIFFNRVDLMETAYYKEKRPLYYKGIAKKEIKVVRFSTAKRELEEVANEYSVKAIIAHNARFDRRALDRTTRYLTKKEEDSFFSLDIPYWCTQQMAKDTICKMKSYEDFSKENDLLTKRGQTSSSAENLYRFILNNPNYKEVHMGFEDVKIEQEIFLKCNKQKKKMRREIP